MAGAGAGAAELDHLVLAVPDLEAAMEGVRAATGVEAVLGGSHPGMGTRNALVRLRGQGLRRAYLELLAPDPTQPPVPAARTMLGVGHLLEDPAGFGQRLHAWAVRPADLDHALAAARAAGVDVGSAVGARRTTPAGTRLTWRLAVPTPLGLGGVQPFLIAWGGGAHPTDDDLPVLDLEELHLAYPDPSHAASVLDLLGVEHEVVRARVPGLHAAVAGPRGRLRL